MCELTHGKLAPPRIQSELCEFLGIASTALGYPAPEARVPDIGRKPLAEILTWNLDDAGVRPGA